jgi:hypothetical protein
VGDGRVLPINLAQVCPLQGRGVFLKDQLAGFSRLARGRCILPGAASHRVQMSKGRNLSAAPPENFEERPRPVRNMRDGVAIIFS